MDLDINFWQAFGVVPEDGSWQMFKAFSPMTYLPAMKLYAIKIIC